MPEDASKAPVAPSPSGVEGTLPSIRGFKILGTLGSGAMGVVYKARQVSMDRLVALKVLSPELARDSEYVQRFLREARSAAKLNHTNIVQGIDVGNSGGVYYFAMEFVDGPTVGQILDSEKRLDETSALLIVRSVGVALDHAWQNRIVHRDVKPDNILLSRDGAPKLADLGLARSVEWRDRITLHGTGLGTPYYMSPEQTLGDDVDARSDLYSLGATLFHMVTGTVPFDGPTHTAIAVKHVTEPVPDPRTRYAGLSDAAADLILWMMSKERERRPQTPVALIADMDSRFPHLLPARPGRASKVVSAPHRGYRDERGRRLVIPALASVAVLLCVALGGVFLTLLSPRTQSRLQPVGSGKETATAMLPSPSPPEPSPHAGAEAPSSLRPKGPAERLRSVPVLPMVPPKLEGNPMPPNPAGALELPDPHLPEVRWATEALPELAPSDVKPAEVKLPPVELQPLRVPQPALPALNVPALGPTVFTIVPKADDTVRVAASANEVKIRLDLHARPGEARQYFRIEIAVAKPAKLAVIPKDVAFVCDVSMSMKHTAIMAARDALGRYLRVLRPTDRFNVILFSEEPRKLFPDFVDPTPERIEAATRFVDRMPGQLRTDVYRVLNAVVRDVAEQAVRNRPTNIFFISDGRSTLGIRDARRIVNEISAYAKPTFAILPFDAGEGGNRYLLDLLAYRSRGQATFADNVEGAEPLLAGLLNAYDKPVLMQLRLTYTNVAVDEIYPSLLPNLYIDQPIVLYGRCTPGQNVTIQLEGKIPYAGRTLQYSHTPGAPDPKRDDIAREWARQKIHHLVSDLARVGETPEAKAQIQKIGREYSVRTPYGR